MHDAPEFLGAEGRAAWVDIALRLGPALDSEAERVALRSFCAAVDRCARARAQVEQEGELIEDARGNPVKHPMLEVERAAMAEVSRGLKRYRSVPHVDASARTVRDWAALLNCSVAAAHKWVARGVLVEGMTAEEARRVVAEARREAGPADEDRAESARLKAARREKLQLETARLAGELLPLAEVQERWLTMTARWVAAMRAVPARYESQLAAFSGEDPAACRIFLQGIMSEALGEARLTDE